MAKTYNPRVARPLNVNRFRGVTSALTRSSVPDELTVAQHNVESREIRQLSTRRGLNRVEHLIEEPTVGGYDIVSGEAYGGSIYQRVIGAEIAALAEGTRVWTEQVFPFASGPASSFTFTAEWPTFLPPDFPDGPDFPLVTIEIPDGEFTWPGLPPFKPQGPSSTSPPPYPAPDDPNEPLDPNDPPDAPYGPHEPPGFPAQPPTTPCGWKREKIVSNFRFDVVITQWQIVQTIQTWESTTGCVILWCEPSGFNCQNFEEAKDLAVAWAKGLLSYVWARDGKFITTTVPGELSSNCDALDWTLESSSGFGETELIVSPLLCDNAEFPPLTLLYPNRMKWEDWVRNYKVRVNATIVNYKPVALATNMCRRPTLSLEWQNGYKRAIPVNAEASWSLDGNDLLVEDWELGPIDELKSNVGYPTYTPCDLKEPNEVFIRCEQDALVWDCAGVPPPALSFGS